MNNKIWSQLPAIKKSKIGEDYSCSSDDDDSLNEIKMHFHRFPENFLSLIIRPRSCWVCLSLTYEIFMIIKRFNVAFYGRNLLSPHCLFSPFLLLVLRQKRCEKSHFCSIEYRQQFFLSVFSKSTVDRWWWWRRRTTNAEREWESDEHENFKRIMMRETFNEEDDGGEGNDKQWKTHAMTLKMANTRYSFSILQLLQLA